MTPTPDYTFDQVFWQLTSDVYYAMCNVRDQWQSQLFGT